MHLIVGDENRFGGEGLVTNVTSKGFIASLLLVSVENVSPELPLATERKLFVTMRTLHGGTHVCLPLHGNDSWCEIFFTFIRCLIVFKDNF